MTKTISFLTSFMLFTSLFLTSQFSVAAGINERQQNQRERIVNGVQSGELTRHETSRLARNQARIHANEARYKSDGVFTARERASVQHQQNRASARIYRQKHDHQSRN